MTETDIEQRLQDIRESPRKRAEQIYSTVTEDPSVDIKDNDEFYTAAVDMRQSLYLSEEVDQYLWQLIYTPASNII